MAKDDLTPLDPDQVITPPTSYRLTGGDPLSPASQEIINNNSDLINSFVKAQRDVYHQSGLDQHKATFSSPDLDIVYHKQFGQERVELTPYPVPVVTPEPPQPVYPPPPKPIFIGFEPPVPPEPDPLCLLVLYKGNRTAAFFMSGLDVSTLVPVYFGAASGSNFAQPVITGQYQFGPYEFIHTDVDLTGKNLQASVFSTTQLLDAISLGRQCLPIFNSSLNTGQPYPTGQALPATTTVYTSTGVYTYASSKFKLKTAPYYADQQPPVTYQPIAITSAGIYYYGPTYATTDQLLSLSMDQTSVDTTELAKEVTTYTNPITTWVTIYEANYVSKVEQQHSLQYQVSVSPVTEKIGTDPTTGQPLTEVIYPNTVTSVTSLTETTTTTLVANVNPGPGETDPDTGLEILNDPHQYQYDQTVALAYGYVGISHTVDQQMTFADLIVAYDVQPYYGYSLTDNTYENIQPPSTPQFDFSGSFYRTTYSTKDGLEVTADAVSASITQTTTITTNLAISIPHYPDFGGDMFIGTVDDGESSEIGTAADGVYNGLPIETYSSGREIVFHTTIDPDVNPGPTATYDAVEQAYANCLNKIETPLPGPNGGLGGVMNFSGYDANITTVTTDNTGIQPDPYSGYPEVVPGVPTTSTSVTGGGDPGQAPGYLAQTIANVYNGTLTWLTETLTSYSDDQDDIASDAGVLVLPFPPGTPTKCFYTRTVTPTNSDTATTDIVTPYKTFPNVKSSTLKPWCHVCNLQHMIQGWLIDTTPYLYLDGSDLLTPLAKVLQCAATDVAAVYMDIRLSAIQSLVKITSNTGAT